MWRQVPPRRRVDWPAGCEIARWSRCSVGGYALAGLGGAGALFAVAWCGLQILGVLHGKNNVEDLRDMQEEESKKAHREPEMKPASHFVAAGQGREAMGPGRLVDCKTDENRS